MRYYHKHSGREIKVKNGFNWPAFLFGALYLFFKGLFKHAVIFFTLAVVAFKFLDFIGVIMVWLYVGNIANELIAANLMNNGFEKIETTINRGKK